jgi:hypothetical protein
MLCLIDLTFYFYFSDVNVPYYSYLLETSDSRDNAQTSKEPKEKASEKSERPKEKEKPSKEKEKPSSSKEKENVRARGDSSASLTSLSGTGATGGASAGTVSTTTTTTTSSNSSVASTMSNSSSTTLLVPPVNTARVNNNANQSPMRTSDSTGDIVGEARLKLSPRSLIEVIERGGDGSEVTDEYIAMGKPLTQLDSRR